MKIIVRNTLHNTETYIIIKNNNMKISLRQEKECWKKLCGMKYCSCSGVLGVRGSYNLPAIMDNFGNILEYDEYTRTFEYVGDI